MKIKFDKELAEKLSVVGVQAIFAAIKDNKMSLDFEVDGIEGMVYVRNGGYNGYHPGTETYNFTIKLFDNIILIENGTAMVGYRGDAIGIAQDQIRMAISAMVSALNSHSDPSADLIKQVHAAIATPGNKTIHIPAAGVEVTFQYLQVKRDDGQGDNTSFETIFTVDGQVQGQFTQFGNCSMAVNPLHTGIMSILVPQILQLIKLRKSPEFYITEFMTYSPAMMQYNPIGGGIVNGNGSSLFSNPMQFNQGQRAFQHF